MPTKTASVQKFRAIEEAISVKNVKSPIILLGILSILVLIVICLYALRLEHLQLFPSEKEAICQPPPAVFFLKLHKCAGSTIQNIVFRLSEKLQMQVALPQRGNYFGHPAHFLAEMVHQPAGTSNMTHHALAHHMRLDLDQVTQVMGKDAVWLTVMRRPVDQFISMFTYYRLRDIWNVTLEDFASAPTDVVPPESPGRHFVPNQMTFDLGFDATRLQTDNKLQEEMVATVQKRFALVLMADLLDESLVLLRDQLCLAWDDVVVFRHNVRPPRMRTDAERNITLRRLLRHHLAADSALYHHFHSTLRQQLREHGVVRVERGVNELRKRTLYWANKCKGWRFIWPGEPTVLPPHASSGSARDVWMCSRLFAHELVYTDHIRVQQELRQAQLSGVKQAPKPVQSAPPQDDVPESELSDQNPSTE